MYPVLSANILGVFNCRDLGFSGVFLRGDYAVSCESDSYQATRQVALLGIVVVPIGVPLFFAALIYHRDCKWLTQPAFFLHGNFLPAWRYFEVLDLVRKLLLTSIGALHCCVFLSAFPPNHLCYLFFLRSALRGRGGLHVPVPVPAAARRLLPRRAGLLEAVPEFQRRFSGSRFR